MCLFWLRRYWWEITVMLSALMLGVLVSLPNLLPLFSSLYRGVPLHRNADEFLYLARVEEAISGGWMGTAFTGGGERLPVLQPALLEWILGIFGRLFGIHAVQMLLLEDFFVPLFLFLTLVVFSRVSGFRRTSALAIAWAFAFLELYNLNRPVHQRTSFLLLLLALFIILRSFERRSWMLAIGAGGLLGLLPSVYFWSWTAGWGWLGVFSLLSLISMYWRQRRRGGVTRSVFFPYLLVIGVVMMVVAVPFFLNTWETTQYPLYSEAFFRSGVGFTRLPESWIWSALFSLMAMGISIGWWNGNVRTPMTCTVLTAFLLLNQHMIHGIRFLFASHYLFFLVLAAVVTVAALWNQRRWHSIAAIGAAALFLAGIAYDSRYVLSQWRLEAAAFADQHLADALPFLRALPPSVILSDLHTSSFLAAHTQHNVLYSSYIQHELRSHRDIAERYCLAQLPIVPVLRRPDSTSVLVYGAAYDGIRDPQERARVRQEELALVADSCAAINDSPPAALAHFGVTYVFWNEQREPEWELGRLHVPLEKVEQGEGWSLWKLKAPLPMGKG